MSQKKRDRVRQAWDREPVPEVSADEWDRVWGDMVRSLRQGGPAGRRPRRTRRLAYAATFLLGVGIGAAGTSLLASRGVSPPTDARPSSETRASKTAEPAQSEGVEFWGLRNVRVKALEASEQAPQRYRLEGETERGIKVVYVYPAKAPVKPSRGGGQ